VQQQKIRPKGPSAPGGPGPMEGSYLSYLHAHQNACNHNECMQAGVRV